MNKNVRDVLKSPAWKNRLKTGAFPYFCVYNGFCRYFEDKNGLDAHLRKNPAHRLHNFPEYQKECERRVHLRQNSYMNKIKNQSRSERSPTPTNSIKSNSSNGSRGRSISPHFRSTNKCPDCFLELPTLEKYEEHVRNRVLHCQSYRPPSPKVPHPDDVKFDQLLENSNNKSKSNKIPLVPKLPESVTQTSFPPLKPWSKLKPVTKTPTVNHPLVNKWKETMTKIKPATQKSPKIIGSETSKTKDPRLGLKSTVIQDGPDQIEAYDISDPQKVERNLGLRRKSMEKLSLQKSPKPATDPIMKANPKNVPTTVSSSILGKLNLSMPKPDFSRSQSLDLADIRPKSNPRLLERDPRKRKSSLIHSNFQALSSDLLQREPVAKIPKSMRIEPETKQSNNPKPIGPRKKISMAQYLNKSSSSQSRQDNLQSSDRLPALPAVDELFTSQDSFEPESVQVPVRVPTPDEPLEEPKEDFEKQYFSKRLKNTVSSWNVTKKTLRRNSVVSESKLYFYLLLGERLRVRVN